MRVDEEQKKAHEEKDKADKGLEITIRTPTGKWSNSFDKTEKISQVIAMTVAHFALQPGDYKLERKTPAEVLDPNRNLVSYQIQDGDVLTLVPPDGGGQ